ncbi:MAG: hypothetical protein GKS05_06860 [Nitrospirales bacterium]|nr:hypothetical protein [Nitrospirales bacterium]
MRQVPVPSNPQMRNNRCRTILTILTGLTLSLLLTGCGGNPYLDASLDPAKFEGKPQSWFEDQWGTPSGKSKRFFGGETWTYSRIAGGTRGLPFWNFTPNQCQITLDFDENQKLDDYSYSGC